MMARDMLRLVALAYLSTMIGDALDGPTTAIAMSVACFIFGGSIIIHRAEQGIYDHG